MNPEPQDKPKVIAVAGGIGTGKSMVCKILRKKGFNVYDCDSEAKMLMDNSVEIRQRIADEISPKAVNADGSLNRKALADIVFCDKKALDTLNSIVHEAVRRHLASWVGAKSGCDVVFVETAILYQSRLDKHVDSVWFVDAPDEVRIVRVMERNNIDRKDVEARILSQQFSPETPHPNVHTIVNDGFTAVLPQINMLLERE